MAARPAALPEVRGRVRVRGLGSESGSGSGSGLGLGLGLGFGFRFGFRFRFRVRVRFRDRFRDRVRIWLRIWLLQLPSGRWDGAQQAGAAVEHAHPRGAECADASVNVRDRGEVVVARAIPPGEG